jgi:hypothetical protein
MGILVVNEDVAGPAPGVVNQEAVDAVRGASDAGTWVSGNLVEDNQNGAAVAPCGDEPVCNPSSEAFGTVGIGIYVVGVRGARVEHNVVRDHDRHGIAVFGFPGGWPAVGNTVVGNDVSDTRSGYDLVQDVSAGPGNCWTGNTGNAHPSQLQSLWACESGVTAPGGVPAAADCVARRGACQASLTRPGPDMWAPTSWKAYDGESAHRLDERARVNAPDDRNDRSFRNDGAVDAWLPEVRPYCPSGTCG